MKIPSVTLMDGDGRYVWTGTLTQFARDNSHDTVRECIAQWRASLAAGYGIEPAFIGGGASPHFNVLLSD
jgi:hypothetical protein